jgi:hypothetical protein
MKRALIGIGGLILAIAAAFAIDEWSYARWERQMAAASGAFVRAYQGDQIWFSTALPGGAGLLSKPSISFLAFYQPPAAAWTYHVSQHSLIGYRLVTAYQSGKRLFLRGRGRYGRHAPYVIGVRRCMPYDPCLRKNEWEPFVEHQDDGT